MQLNMAETIRHNAVNMALYSPFSYIFQVAGVGIGQVVTHNTYVMVWLGSLCNIAGCTLLLYYSIQYIPYGKGALLFLSLTPMALQERASLSVDAITYAMVVAMVAFCLYMRQPGRRIKRAQLGLMYFILFFLASCKVVYFVAGFLILLIPSECFGSRKKGIFHKISGVLFLLILSVGWLFIANSYLDATRAGGSAAEKIQFILQNPGRYLYIMDKMIWESGEEFFCQMIGSKLGSMDIEINRLLILLFTFTGVGLFWGGAAWEKEEGRRDGRMALALLLLSLASVVLIFTSLYIQWTDLGASTYEIEGLQGRYFLPVAPILLCALLAERENEPSQNRPSQNGAMVKQAYLLYVLNLLVLISVFGHSSYL